MIWFRSDSSKITKEIIEWNLHPEINKRFLRRFLSGRIDPYVDYKLRKNRFGKFRAISSPLPPLKLIQARILTDLYSIPCHPAAHAYVPGKSVITAANEHLGMKWGIRLDLEDFFHHVTHHRVNAALISEMDFFRANVYATLITRSPIEVRSRIPSKYNRRFNYWGSRKWKVWLRNYVINRFATFEAWPAALWETQQITGEVLSNEQKKRRFLPQGSPTSGYAANLTFKKLDQKITRYSNALGFSYTRYSDDILISTKTQEFDRELAARIVAWIQGQLAIEGYTLNRKKTRILTPGSRMSYLGMLVDGDSTRLPKEVRDRFSGELRDISKFGFESQSIRFQEGLSRIRRAPAKESNFHNNYWDVLVGWISWIKAADKPLFAALQAKYFKPDLTNNYGDGSNAEAAKILSDLFKSKPWYQKSNPTSTKPNIVDIDLNSWL